MLLFYRGRQVNLLYLVTASLLSQLGMPWRFQWIAPKTEPLDSTIRKLPQTSIMLCRTLLTLTRSTHHNNVVTVRSFPTTPRGTTHSIMTRCKDTFTFTSARSAGAKNASSAVATTARSAGASARFAGTHHCAPEHKLARPHPRGVHRSATSHRK